MPPTRDTGTGVPAPGKESTGGASAKGCTRGRVEDEHEDGRSEERDRMPHPVARLIAAPAVPDGVAPLRLSRTQPIKKSRTRWRILASIDASDTSAASSTYAAPRVPMSNGRRCPITIAVSSSIPRPSVRRFCVSRPAGARCCGHHEVLHLGHAELGDFCEPCSDHFVRDLCPPADARGSAPSPLPHYALLQQLLFLFLANSINSVIIH